MRDHLTLLVALWLLYSPLVAAKDAVTCIELHAYCADRAPCVFDGGHVELVLEVFNAGPTAVPLPAEYYRRRGPVARLVDNATGVETSLGVGRPRPALMHRLQVLAPSEAFRFRWRVRSDQILKRASQPVDVTARFAYSLQPERGAKADFIWGEVRIVEK